MARNRAYRREREAVAFERRYRSWFRGRERYLSPEWALHFAQRGRPRGHTCHCSYCVACRHGRPLRRDRDRSRDELEELAGLAS